MNFATILWWSEILQHVQDAGWWFAAVLLLWIPIYTLNAWSWYLIVENGGKSKIGFWRLWKYTVSGYALNYITPVGVMGGEPYRIVELTPYIGAERATSSVILYSMMHIFSHFCFWSVSLVLLIFMYGTQMSITLWILSALAALFCAIGIYFFAKGYQNGLAFKALRIFSHLPWVGKYIHRFTEKNEQSIHHIDLQIAELHKQRKSTFYASLSLEFAARILGCLELMFCLLLITDKVSFWDCVLMQAFTSLFANLIFFIPMQMGVREGGMALFADFMKTGSAYGVLTSLLVRLREIVWIAIGLLLLKIANKKGEKEENVS